MPATHGKTTRVPSQALPAGHLLQLVRVAVLPPLVKLPVGHVRHASAPGDVWYLLSAPQSVHAFAPFTLNLPARHCLLVSKDPSGQAYPDGQGVHCARVSALSPPFAKDPAAHVSHVLEPAEEYRAPLPHAAHVAPPGLATNSKCEFSIVYPAQPVLKLMGWQPLPRTWTRFFHALLATKLERLPHTLYDFATYPGGTYKARTAP